MPIPRNLAQPMALDAHETREIASIQRELTREFDGTVPAADVAAVVSAALARLEPIRRRELVPQLVRTAARSELSRRNPALVKPLHRTS